MRRRVKPAVVAAAVATVVVVAVVIGLVAWAWRSPATPPFTTTQAQGPVYGDPADAARFWSEQSHGDCVLMATTVVIGLMTGDLPTEDEIVSLAENTPSVRHDGPMYTPGPPDDPDADSGTAVGGIQPLLKHYGIEASYTSDDAATDVGLATGTEALEQYLGNGHKVMVSVNGEALWGEDGDHTESDHTVVVGAVDTDQNVVYLSPSLPLFA